MRGVGRWACKHEQDSGGYEPVHILISSCTSTCLKCVLHVTFIIVHYFLYA